MNRFFLVLIMLVCFSCAKKEDLPTTVNIHENWTFKKSGSEWNTATVPGNVYSDLLDHDKIPDPFVGTNELNVQWVSKSNWEYQTTFTLDEETLKKSHIELTFEGIDTYAAIYLNDSLLGKTNNAFRTWNFDIKKAAKAQNSLRVDFEKTSIHEDKEIAKLDYTLPSSPRVFTRKAQFQYGWDWGPIINTSGIWKPVTLEAWDDIHLDDIYFKQEKLTDAAALVTVAYTITADENIEKSTFEIKYDNTTHKVASNLKKGTHTYTTNLEIKNPKRWWTHNLGDPYLYEFEVSLKKGSTLKAKRTVKKGFKTIELVTDKDEKGSTFHFLLNGVPVFMKGANYIPQHSMQNKVTDAHYEKILNDAVAVNMNMLRVWGGGIYENDIFYQLCDEKGILVWQDFMFACAMYPGDKDFLDNVAQEAAEQVTRLRNYTSIGLWCGNNENNEGWHRWGWQSDKTEAQKEEIWNAYLAVFDSILPKTVEKLNGTISYWESSPKYGRGNPKSEFEGDSHDWGVWHDAYPFERFEQKVPRFMSEFGFQSFPSYEAIRYFTGQDSIDINHDSYVTHQKHPRGFKLIREYMARDYKVPVHGDDYVYVSQLVQAKGMTMGIEAQRRAMPYCMGSLYWQFNDCWPVVSWSSIDFMGNWKALHYKAKKSFEDVLVSSIMKNDTINTYIVSDKLQPQNGMLTVSFLDFEGTKIQEFNKTVNMPANTSHLAIKIPIKELKINPNTMVMKSVFDFAQTASTSTPIKTNTESSDTQKASSLFYLVKPKELVLPEQAVKHTITKVENGFEIRLNASTLQKDVFLHTKAKGHFSDNFFDVLPGETVTITFITEAENIDDLEIKTLNGIE